MQQFLSSVPQSDSLIHFRSRGDVLYAPAGSLGSPTERLRSLAIASVISNPISLHSRLGDCSAELEASPPPGASPAQVAAARRLLQFMPESSFIEMAGGPAAYAATPVAERQLSNFRTVCHFVGRKGDTGIRLASLIVKLIDYRADRGIGGDLWPLYPCILANFALHLQLQSPKEGATSVAPRCVSAFVSAAKHIKLPVFVDSPHLGAVPAHQASGDGFTGFMPLDIMRYVEYIAAHEHSFSPGLHFDACCAYTIWEGSCRIQDWVKTRPGLQTMAPLAHSVYRIEITKNGERNTLFAVGSEGICFPASWRHSFNDKLRAFGSCPRLASSDYTSSGCTPVAGSSLDAKEFSRRMGNLISYCASRCGYTRQNLKDLHIVPHSLHGSFAAYAEAMEWGSVPTHRLGRWRLPADPSAVASARARRGAGSAGPKTIAAVYSTAASCQIQLELRCRVMSAIRAIGSNFSTHGDLSCFISSVPLEFRGPDGHSARSGHTPRHDVPAGVPVATVKSVSSP